MITSRSCGRGTGESLGLRGQADYGPCVSDSVFSPVASFWLKLIAAPALARLDTRRKEMKCHV